ncbi:MAG: response regulator transcription factor [Beijerinckiaceae bacterium]|nr:response regulator transcription factor [Beijerinckiaceae bacterium]
MKDAAFIALIDLNPIKREGLLSFLRAGGFQHCGGFASLTAFCDQRAPDRKRLVFLIACQKSSTSLQSTTESVREHFPDALVVLLADTLSDAFTLCALRSICDGLLLSQINGDVLVKYLELVLMGEKVFPVKGLLSASDRDADPDCQGQDARWLEALSSRELEVLLRLTAGHANKVIARQCGITESTVKVHVKAILRKIHAKNRTQAAIWARRNGVSPEMVVRPSANSILPLPNAIDCSPRYEAEKSQKLGMLGGGSLSLAQGAGVAPSLAYQRNRI